MASYKIEWWTVYGVTEKQTIKLHAATGGTWVVSFLGESTPTLAFDVSAAGLETELEALFSITDVTVSKTATGAVSSYEVLFAGNTGPQNALVVDGALLQSSTTAASGVCEGGSDGTVADGLITCTSASTKGTLPTNYCSGLDVCPEVSSLSYTITGLSRGVVYTCRVLAGNAQGYSTPSVGLTATPRSAPEPPLSASLKGVAGSSTSLKVYFKLPSLQVTYSQPTILNVSPLLL